MTAQKIIGYASGVFDLFHTGHLNLLKKAKGQCDFLIVAVTVDPLVVKLKGKETIVPFEERIEIVKSIRYVDMAVPEETTDKIMAWNKFRFNKIFKGTDWKGSEIWNKWEKELEHLGAEVIFIPSIGPRSTELRKAITDIE